MLDEARSASVPATAKGAEASPAWIGRVRAAAPRRRGTSVSFYRSLLTSLGTAILLLGGMVMLLTFLTSQRAVTHLSGIILEQNAARTELQLEKFFAPAIRHLQLVASWGAAGLLPLENSAVMNRLLVPLLQSDGYLSAVMVADERGREHIVFHFGQDWRSRQMLRDVRGDRAAVSDWSDARPVPIVRWEDIDYDPRQRPWYRGALDTSTASATHAARAVYWTAPYVFFTRRAPGMTAAVTFRSPDGRVHVAGCDVLLTDISAFTTGLTPGRHGKVVVLSAEDQVVGLPRDRRFADAAARAAFLLKGPHELGLPVVADAVQRLRSRASTTTGPLRFTTGGESWWADLRGFDLGPSRQLAMVVMVPESDLVGDMRHVQLGTLVLMLAGLALAILRAAQLARRYSRPIEALALASERISRGDLEPGVPISAPVAEVTRLVDAHERMRAGLTTLLKLERDLQVARRIQQDTFPTSLPVLAGFDIAAWNEPAEETGGDSYDVIGCAPSPGLRAPRLGDAGATRAVLLLADATGHGIGPALSVTEVRAMLRMAVRTGEDLPAIVTHLNAQLCADLSEGRFVSAWLGELDGRTATLASYSCGQGPILHYRARDGVCDVLETDTVPLGLMDDLDVRLRPPVALGPGDVFVVASDGIVEAVDGAGAAFGTPRLIDLVVRHHAASAAGIVQALREALAAFTGATPPDDDRTVVVISRATSLDGSR